MKIIWLGHASLRIEIGDQVLLIDPWLDGNPAFPDGLRGAALAGVTAILVTHAHGDHASEVPQIARETGAPVYGIVELMNWWDKTEGLDTTGFNRGGTVALGDVRVTMVNATHSSAITTEDGPLYMGGESGFMIRGEGRTIYVSGDTDIMADMAWMGEYHRPDIGILSAGGHFTMDMEMAAFVATKYFNFTTVIPYHYKTFPLLAQSAKPLIEALPGTDVREPEVMQAIDI
ncbi:metal-dependent hydrolase [Mesobaculum littorinae]|uniref:UPF0173 metal-dependent hydrolase EKE94_16355 n=1 Tax=Mesobaculum littorinae TaxID=2486419 RepID=A0A438ADZ5_9RHOB|nr:metal-dependent hydrolase [Mesobaculum littorinae]RVV96911.1 metal-dependent hydrolase [Mesobaculum littorinae]